MDNGRKAISILYRTHWQKLYIHACNLLNDGESAKDVVNDVFCSVLENSVQLEGKACFEVAKNAACPFIVSADGMDTRVLGTKFNVRSYTSSDRHVTLVNGKVQVTNTANQSSVLLQPGQDLTYTATGEEKISNVNIATYTAWTEGMFYFEDTKLKDIMSAMGRWYNVNIDFELLPVIITVSIMDYARFNYVAQPEDRISPKGLFPRIGDYDKWVIKWGYQYRPEFKDAYKEKEVLRTEVTKKLRADKRMWFVGDEGKGSDPRSQSEDLGDNNMKANEYGMKNLKLVDEISDRQSSLVALLLAPGMLHNVYSSSLIASEPLRIL